MKKILLISLIAVSMSLYGQTNYEKTIKDLNMEELVKTYPKEKVNKALKNYKNLGDNKDLAAKAVLVDIGAITISDLNNNKNVDKKLDNFVKDYQDTKENYIGNASDKNILERVQHKLNSAKVVKETVLLEVLNNAMAKGLTTGYNIKNKEDYANFDESLTMTYGHSDIIHAKQLIALLKSEGLDPKIQLEPKTSAFIYLPDWGTPSYDHIKLKDGTVVATPLEYDLKFQFKTKKEKTKFAEIVEKYAKKDSEDEPGLIYKSWWQPFVQTEKIDGYNMLIDNTVTDGKYEAHVLTLPEKSQTLIEELKKNKSLEIKTKEVWVNPAFYRFMLGEYK